MSARRVARELAVIVMPQLPKNEEKLSNLDITELVDRAVHMLVDYARQNLKDAGALVVKSHNDLLESEVTHADNEHEIRDLKPITMTTADLKENFQLVERAINMVTEAIDIPSVALSATTEPFKVVCKRCGSATEVNLERAHREEVRLFVQRLVGVYLENRAIIDEFIKRARAKFRIERMVSIDRDILRLACAEAFYMTDIPVNVAISEAVELSHRFADEKAAKFINGILADLAEEAEAVRRATWKKTHGGNLPAAAQNTAPESNEQ
jgi:transcription antitermination protein NusB